MGTPSYFLLSLSLTEKWSWPVEHRRLNRNSVNLVKNPDEPLAVCSVSLSSSYFYSGFCLEKQEVKVCICPKMLHCFLMIWPAWRSSCVHWFSSLCMWLYEEMQISDGCLFCVSAACGLRCFTCPAAEPQACTDTTSCAAIFDRCYSLKVDGELFFHIRRFWGRNQIAVCLDRLGCSVHDGTSRSSLGPKQHN